MLFLLVFSGCITKTVDRLTVDQVLKAGLTIPDTQKACALGESLSHVLLSTGRSGKDPNLAMIIANGTAGICAQKKAWEHDLLIEKMKKNLPLEAGFRIAEIKDTKIQGDRWHGLAAQRFYRAFKYAEKEYGVLGEECPKIKEKDESAYFIALLTGTFAVLHDKSSGGQVGVSLELLPKIARASECLDSEKWWNVPSALQAGIWATIPGLTPEGVSPWDLMMTEAVKGADSGVRVAWGVAAMLANNAGKEELLERVLISHGESLGSVDQNEEWAFFDEFAFEVSLQQSDMIWIQELGYRTPEFGNLPKEEIEVLTPNDGEDPFDIDPFQ